jgi:hypothetical protein
MELSRWGVSNTFTNTADSTVATNNSNGINNALTWAAQEGYTEFVLPKGTYLIHETLPILPKSNMTLDLGGSTLRIRDNGLAGYSVICFKQNQVFSRITNGIIQGDRYNHNYTTPGQASTHEWGMGILFPNTVNISNGEGVNCRYITIDNVEFLDLTGDGVSLFATQGLLYATVTPTKSYAITFEQGSINPSNGSLVSDSTRIRSNIFLDLTNPAIVHWKTFGIYGDVTYQSVGSEIDSNEPFDIIFYNADGSYNSSLTYVEFFDEIPLPAGATQAKIVLHQANIPSSSGNGLTLRCMTIPKYIYVEKCHIHHCRRLGLALQGAKFVWLRNNDVHHISGTAPAASIDVEDNYALNQNLWIEDNFLHDCPLHIIFVKGKNFHIKSNKIERGIGMAVKPGVKKLFIDSNYLKDTSLTIDGECVVTNNHFHRSGCTLGSGTTDPAVVDNNIFTNGSLIVNRPKPYCVTVSNCSFSFDLDYSNSVLPAGFNAGLFPQTMTNCSFDGYLGSSYVCFTGDNNATEGWTYTNVLFNNTRKPNGNSSLGLTRGTYIGCKFNNPGRLWPNKRVELIECTFTWDGQNLFEYSGNELSRFFSCTFNGGSSTAFYFSAQTQGRVELINNIFEYNNSSSTTQGFIDGYWGNVTGGTLLMDGNRFKSNLVMKVINAPNITSDAFQIIFKNNTIEGNLTYVVDQTQMSGFANNVINGTIDPYDWATAAPTSGFYKLGKQFKNLNMNTDGFMGWICTKEGFLNSYSDWVPSTNYSLYNRITVNGYVYYCTNRLGGKSAKVAPNFPTIPTYSTVSDNAGMTGWSAKSYSVGDVILPTSSNGTYFYECTKAGTAGTKEPTWGAGTVTDGTVVWSQRYVIVWKLLGATGGIFKQFGHLN